MSLLIGAGTYYQGYVTSVIVSDHHSIYESLYARPGRHIQFAEWVLGCVNAYSLSTAFLIVIAIGGKSNLADIAKRLAVGACLILFGVDLIQLSFSHRFTLAEIASNWGFDILGALLITLIAIPTFKAINFVFNTLCSGTVAGRFAASTILLTAGLGANFVLYACTTLFYEDLPINMDLTLSGIISGFSESIPAVRWGDKFHLIKAVHGRQFQMMPHAFKNATMWIKGPNGVALENFGNREINVSIAVVSDCDIQEADEFTNRGQNYAHFNRGLSR